MIDPDDAVTLIIAELKAREIHAWRSTSIPDSQSVAISISASAAQRFLDALVSAPLDRDDAIARHIVGRGADLTIDEDPWQWEGSIYVTDDSYVRLGAGALELHVIVNIPYDDLPEVMRRLGINATEGDPE